MGKRGNKVKGFVFERGGTWYAEWTAFKVRNRKSTGIRVGKTRKERKDSREAAEKILAGFVSPYKAGAEVDVRASLVARQRSAEEAAMAAEEEARRAETWVLLKDAWKRHPYTMSQLTRGRTQLHKLSDRNVEENLGAWNRFVRWATGRLGEKAAMQEVTEEDAQAYSDALQSEGLTPQRHNKLIGTAKVMFRLAEVEPNPFDGVAKLREQAPEHREPFTKEQVGKLIGAAEGEWKGFLSVLYYTGLRKGDAALLRGEQRDKAQGKIRVVTHKTGASITVMEHPALTAILDETAAKGRGYLFPKLAQWYIGNPNGLSDHFRRYMARVLGEDGEAFEGRETRQGGVRQISRYGLHSFRHSFASHAAAAGVPLGTVQRWLGHSSAEITRIYTHYGDAMEMEKLLKGMALPTG